MRVLLIKTSSMGDVIHTLPALTDAGRAIPDIQFDWMVEESFTDIPPWHANVARVIPVAWRRWRKNLFSRQTYQEWKTWRQQLRAQQYDLILDAQGLIKSALLSLFARGPRAGLDVASARETCAAWFYQQRYKVNFYQHAVVRMRQLFSHALHYPLPETPPDFGLDKSAFLMPAAIPATEKYLVFLHGTTWSSKQWPEAYWVQLAKKAALAGMRIKIGGGNAAEVARAERIAAQCDAVDVMPYLKIAEMAAVLAHAQAAIAVDTGFGHLAAALGVPTITIYGATNPEYTSTVGERAVNLAAHFPCSPCLKRNCTYTKPSVVVPACYETVPPEKVWECILSS